MANQHADIGEKLSSEIVKDLHSYQKVLKAETKKLFAEAEKYRKDIEAARAQLEKAKEHYDKAHRDTLKATELFHKTDKDNKAAKIDVEKCRAVMNAKSLDEDKSKQEYAEQQQLFNRKQREFYFQTMPQVHNAIQHLEESRILKAQEVLRRVYECHNSVISLICKCIADMANHTSAINPAHDLLMVVRKYVSGEKPPGDVPFIDLSPSTQNASVAISNGAQTMSPGNNALPSSAGNPTRPARGQRSGSIKGNAEDFSDLQPAQQVRRLKVRIDELEKNVEKEKKALEGLERMLDTFQTTEKGGDVQNTKKMLEEMKKKYRAAQEELDKFNVCVFYHPSPEFSYI